MLKSLCAYNANYVICYILIGRQPAMVVRIAPPINQLLNDESIPVQNIFFGCYVKLAMDFYGTQD